MAEKSGEQRMDRKENDSHSHCEKPFDHPVYKKLALLNGEVNKMSKADLQNKLKELKLDTRGVKEVLKKRLKNYFKKQKLMRANVRPEPRETQCYDYYLVIDFEATCDEHNFNYNHEIIEFPVVLVDASERTVVDEFHSYVKPVKNPRLTPFCTQLTGITQRQVSKSETFDVVLKRVECWLEDHALGTSHSFAVVTDGPWDMGRFMYNQCKLSSISFPEWARKWCNIRKAYGNFYRCRKAKLTEMLQSMGMSFEGNQHSGIDDSRNIARILIRLLQDGAAMRQNERIFSNKLKRLENATGEEVHFEAFSEDSEGEEGVGGDSGLVTENLTEDKGSTEKCSTDFGVPGKIVESLAKLHLKDCVGDAAGVSEDSDGFDDLLQYYSLQKS